MKTKAVQISEIAIDGDTQQREKINEDTIAEYAEAMRCGAKFPAVTLFFDGAQYWLADGFHRYHATVKVPALDILADVHEGTKRDARLFSAGANHTHGQQLSAGDKARSVRVLLVDEEWSKWTDGKISKHCHCSQQYVSKLRKPKAKAKAKPILDNSHTTVVCENPNIHSKTKVEAASTTPSEATPSKEEKSETPKKEAVAETKNETLELHARIEELTATAKELLEENTSMGAVMDADDKLAALTAENKKLREMNRVLNERVHGLQGECNEAKRAAKMWRAKHDKMERLAA